jgi:hypothetical protein
MDIYAIYQLRKIIIDQNVKMKELKKNDENKIRFHLIIMFLIILVIIQTIYIFQSPKQTEFQCEKIIDQQLEIEDLKYQLEFQTKQNQFLEWFLKLFAKAVVFVGVFVWIKFLMMKNQINMQNKVISQQVEKDENICKELNSLRVNVIKKEIVNGFVFSKLILFSITFFVFMVEINILSNLF